MCCHPIDKNYAPFEIVELEEEYTRVLHIGGDKSGIEIKLGGKIDRIDKKNRRVRIIDYKTGQAETKFNSIEKLFDREFEKRNKPIFQTILYSWLYAGQNSDLIINPGLYITRKLFQTDFAPMVVMDKDIFNLNENLEEFEKYLQMILSELMDVSVPFDQTEILKNCEYCPYVDICHRKSSKKF